jgi:uncharacterized protein YuzE
MKIRYDRHGDVLVIDVMPEGIVDHAQQIDGVIFHLAEDGRVVLLEILGASEFVSSLVKVMMQPTADDSELLA